VVRALMVVSGWGRSCVRTWCQCLAEQGPGAGEDGKHQGDAKYTKMGGAVNVGTKLRHEGAAVIGGAWYGGRWVTRCSSNTCCGLRC
jgi:hypothetical protein